MHFSCNTRFNMHWVAGFELATGSEHLGKVAIGGQHGPPNPHIFLGGEAQNSLYLDL